MTQYIRVIYTNINIFDESTNQSYPFAPAQIHGCMKQSMWQRGLDSTSTESPYVGMLAYLQVSETETQITEFPSSVTM